MFEIHFPTEKIKNPGFFLRHMARKETPLGKVTHFYDRIGVAAILLSKQLKQGDKIKIGKEGSLVEQEVASLQLEHEAIKAAKKGQEIGLKISGRVRAGDLVWKG